MASEIIVLGGGVVGVSTAIHLALRGKSVLLVDRREPGRETSFGNAGIIQSEGVYPYRFPRLPRDLLYLASGRSQAVRLELAAAVQLAMPLFQYWKASAPVSYARIVSQYAAFILAAASEHEALSVASGSGHLIRKNGWIKFFRTASAADVAGREAATLLQNYGIRHEFITPTRLRELEPGLNASTAGAIRWVDSWTVLDPGALLKAYLRYFTELGGTVAIGDAATANPKQQGWSLETAQGKHEAQELVIALGHRASAFTRRFGYRFPLFGKRGYHMHYRSPVGLSNLVVDAEKGYLMAPMSRGIRLTTGVEFSHDDGKPTPVQLDRAERIARQIFALGERLDPQPWLGVRPCTADMKPIVGAAPRHKGLWFAFGHAHHGLTLGPLTGRLLAEIMTGETPRIDLTPFSPDRFL